MCAAEHDPCVQAAANRAADRASDTPWVIAFNTYFYRELEAHQDQLQDVYSHERHYCSRSDLLRSAGDADVFLIPVHLPDNRSAASGHFVRAPATHSTGFVTPVIAALKIGPVACEPTQS